MAGGASTPALAAAVSAAGGLGFLAAGYKTADQLAADIEAVRAATAEPFGVNLFVVAPFEPDPESLSAYRRSLEPEAARLGVDLGTRAGTTTTGRPSSSWSWTCAPTWSRSPSAVPTPMCCGPWRSATSTPTVTVTTVAEAREAAARGAASLAVQGPEAGGHRGTWDLRGRSRPDAAPRPGGGGRVRGRGAGGGRRWRDRRGRCERRARPRRGWRLRWVRRTCSRTRRAPTRSIARR